MFKTSSGNPKIEDRRVDAGLSRTAVGGGHWCHCTDQETEAQRDWLPQVPAGRGEGERGKEGRQGGRRHS